LNDSSQDIDVVDLTGPGLVPTGNISDVKMADASDVLGDGCDNITLGDLLMVNVEEKLDRGTVDLINDVECLVGLNEEVARVINSDVEGFKKECHVGLVSQWGDFLERGDAVLTLATA
jgi:hypothetical protein